MDFNIGNLVSSAIGAVAKVATAVVNTLSPVAERGGIIGGIAGAIVGVAQAVLGFTTAFANAYEDGVIDDDEAEELLADIFKLLVGSSILTDSSDGENDDEVLINHICYIFYEPGVVSGDQKHTFDMQAETQKGKYEKKYHGTEVILVPVRSPEEFKTAWNEMDDQTKIIDVVEIILHGSIADDIDYDDYAGAGYLYFVGSGETGKYRIVADRSVIPDDQKDNDIIISDLNRKKINELYFSSCNSANPDAQNTGNAFADIVDANEIVGWDGGAVYDYSKEEDVKGGEGKYEDWDWKYDGFLGIYIYPTSSESQHTWWKYVPKQNNGWPARERQGKTRIK